MREHRLTPKEYLFPHNRIETSSSKETQDRGEFAPNARWPRTEVSPTRNSQAFGLTTLANDCLGGSEIYPRVDASRPFTNVTAGGAPGAESADDDTWALKLFSSQPLDVTVGVAPLDPFLGLSPNTLSV